MRAKQKTVKGVMEGIFSGDVSIEFRQTQMTLDFSETGSIQRELRLKEGDKVEVTIKKVSCKK